MQKNHYTLSTAQTSALHRAHIRSLLSKLDEKTLSGTAYDTAWVGQVTESSGEARASYPQAVDWLRKHQYLDGSWGSGIEYFHDRIISTLSAILTLAKAGSLDSDREAIVKGERYIWANIDHLAEEPYDTVGFELLLPMLFDEAWKVNLNLPYEKCDVYRKARADKLSIIPPSLLYSRKVSSTHSLEFMGKGLKPELLEGLQEPNGSFGNSPSATAYVLTLCPQNLPARRYLDAVIKLDGGSAMSAYPIEVFNKSWVLYNIELTGALTDFYDLAHAHIDSLWHSWDDTHGVGFSCDYPVADLDDTAVVFKLLRRAGFPVSGDAFLQFEKDTYFTCYTFERTPSIGANVHLLDALGAYLSYEHRPRMVKKILKFMRTVRHEDAYWLDKWHISPYYITSHAVIATIGFDDALARDAVRWILSNQRPDGSWGWYRPTAEETAYCLQALITYHNQVDRVDRSAVSHAVDFLFQHYGVWELPSMWIEKCLYTPDHIVESAILSALMMSVSI